MKHINKITRAVHIGMVLLFGLAVFSCDSGTNEAKKDIETAGIKVSGTINIDGAGPALNVSRSATVSIPATITWIIEAETTDYVEEVPRATAYAYTTSNWFDITFATSGAWNISVTGYSGVYGDNDGDNEIDIPSDASPAFSGSLEEVYISEEVSNDALDISVYTNKTSGNGSIELEIIDESESIINGIATISSKQGDSETITKEFVFNGGHTKFELSGIPAGCYIVKFSFEDEIGNVFYSCKEIINVYEGLTTNTWKGNAPYINNGQFILTPEVLGIQRSDYSDFVNSTQTVLYEVDEYSSYSFYLENTDTPVFSNTQGSSFCFDENGNLFIISNVDNLMIDSTWYDCVTEVSSTKTGFGNDGIVSFGSDETTDCIRGFGLINYDTVTQNLYGLSTIMINNNGNYSYRNILYEYPVSSLDSNWTWSEDSSIENHYEINGVTKKITNFAVHNGVLYFVTGNDGDYKLFKSKLSDISFTDISPIELSGLSELKGSVTDCMYQDGNLYFLIKESRTEYVDKLVSRGAVVRYNLLTKTIKFLGWTSDALDVEDVYMYAYYNPGNNEMYWTEEGNNGNKVLAKVSELQYQSQDSGYTDIEGFFVPSISGGLSDNAFYGPSRFIAIKPKKLIIADNGIALYVDENDALNYGNVHRVVTVDLEEFAIESVSNNLDVTFDKKFTKPLFNGCSYPGNAIASQYYVADDAKTPIANDTDVFYMSEYSTPANNLSVAIPSGDGE